MDQSKGKKGGEIGQLDAEKPAIRFIPER